MAFLLFQNISSYYDWYAKLPNYKSRDYRMAKKISTTKLHSTDMESDSSMWCCSQDFCCCCCSLLGHHQSIINRFKYVLILFIGTGLCFLTITLSNLRRNVQTVQIFCNTTVNTATCDKLFGYSAVYRVCFSLCVFHFMMSLFLIGVKSSHHPRIIFHSGFWPLKCLVLISEYQLYITSLFEGPLYYFAKSFHAK